MTPFTAPVCWKTLTDIPGCSFFLFLTVDLFFPGGMSMLLSVYIEVVIKHFCTFVDIQQVP
jgi:hypothetical protein